MKRFFNTGTRCDRTSRWASTDNRSLRLRRWRSPLLALLFLCSWAAPAAIASPIFGNWSLAPNQAASNSGGTQVSSPEQKEKKSRKQRKLEKKRAKARADLIPDILTAKSLSIERTQTNEVALIPAAGDKLILRADGKAHSLSLSAWGSGEQMTAGFSGWEGETLYVESTPSPELHINHSYRVDASGRLIQRIEIYDGPVSHSERRLFVPGKSPPSSPQQN